RYQRTGRIDMDQIASRGFRRHGLRHAVRREYHRPIVRHLAELGDEDRALGLESLDHEAIVHDFVTHIDRPAVTFEGALDDLDGAVDTGTKATRACKQDRKRLLRVRHE